MRVLLLGDIHLSDRPPSSCTDSYNDDIFAILEHTTDLAKDFDLVAWAGDVFHHKQPGRTSHRTVQRVIEVAKAYPRLVLVAGNHDMLNDRYESIETTQPLGVLQKAGIELLSGWMDDFPVYGVPWQQEWSQEAVEGALQGFRDRAGGGGLVVTHAPLYPPGDELIYEYYPTAEWAKAQGSGFCYYGHVHEWHGTYEVGGVTFCNQGAITRGSLHESDLTRKIAVTVWDGSGFERVEVPHKPADEVFRLMEVGEVKDSQAKLDEFLASIGETKVAVTSIEAVMEAIRAKGLDQDVVDLAEELLQEAQA